MLSYKFLSFLERNVCWTSNDGPSDATFCIWYWVWSRSRAVSLYQTHNVLQLFTLRSWRPYRRYVRLRSERYNLSRYGNILHVFKGQVFKNGSRLRRLQLCCFYRRANNVLYSFYCRRLLYDKNEIVSNEFKCSRTVYWPLYQNTLEFLIIQILKYMLYG